MKCGHPCVFIEIVSYKHSLGIGTGALLSNLAMFISLHYIAMINKNVHHSNMVIGMHYENDKVAIFEAMAVSLGY